MSDCVIHYMSLTHLLYFTQIGNQNTSQILPMIFPADFLEIMYQSSDIN